MFEIPSEEGLPIRGDLDVPERACALAIVIHGFKGFKDWGFFPWLAQRLTAQRIAVCRFNMSRSGIGDDPESFDRLDLFEDDTYSRQLADLRTVIAYAQSQVPDLPTHLLGHSRGGGIALLGAADVPNLRGVIAWSPISSVDRWDDAMKRDWRARGFIDNVNTRTQQNMRMSTAILDDYDANAERLNVLASAEALAVPLLVLHGGRDESVAPEEGRRIAASAKDASVSIIQRASHTYNAIHPLIHVPFELQLAAELSARFIEANSRDLRR
ncbi:MAG TPA: alpha/beta fold hydrolase [Thermoanaerobaculia bacterium]